jgi:hypothetical protein
MARIYRIMELLGVCGGEEFVRYALPRRCWRARTQVRRTHLWRVLLVHVRFVGHVLILDERVADQHAPGF